MPLIPETGWGCGPRGQVATANPTAISQSSRMWLLADLHHFGLLLCLLWTLPLLKLLGAGRAFVKAGGLCVTGTSLFLSPTLGLNIASFLDIDTDSGVQLCMWVASAGGTAVSPHF